MDNHTLDSIKALPPEEQQALAVLYLSRLSTSSSALQEDAYETRKLMKKIHDFLNLNYWEQMMLVILFFFLLACITTIAASSFFMMAKMYEIKPVIKFVEEIRDSK